MRAKLVVLVLLAAGCATGTRGVRDGGLRDPSPYEFHRSLALTMLRTEQASLALDHIRTLQRLAPRRAEPYLLLGRAYSQLGVTEQAREMFERAVALDGQQAGAHAALGVLLDGIGDAAGAEREHRRAIALAPENPAYENNLGFSLFAQGRYAEATAAYERALALDAGLRRTHNNVGFAYGRLGALERAESHFRLAGSTAESQNNLGLVLEARGELERAHDHYRAAVASDRSLAEPRANLARVCERLGRPVPALPAGATPTQGVEP